MCFRQDVNVEFEMNNFKILTLDIIAATILAFAGYYLALEVWCFLYGLLM